MTKLTDFETETLGSLGYKMATRDQFGNVWAYRTGGRGYGFTVEIVNEGIGAGFYRSEAQAIRKIQSAIRANGRA